MNSGKLSRRRVLQSIGTGVLAATIPSTSAAFKQASESAPAFGTPIEEEFTISTSQNDSFVGTITDESAFVSFHSWPSNESPSSKIAKIDRFTGQYEWSKTIEDFVYAPKEDDGRLYFDGNEEIYCWDAATGNEQWRRQFPETILGVTSVGDHVFVRGFNYEETDQSDRYEVTNATLYALDPKTGASRWRYNSTSALWSPEIIDEYLVIRENESYLYDSDVVSESGQLVGLNKSTGDVEWKSYSINPQSIVPNKGRFVTQTKENGVYLFKPSGDQLLHYEDEVSTFFITNDRLFLAPVERGLEIFDKNGVKVTNGRIHPEHHITDIEIGPPNDSPVILATASDEILALDQTTFTEQLRISQQSSALWSQYNVLFILHGTNQFTAVDLLTGDKIWTDSIPGATNVDLDAYNGFVYVSGDQSSLYAYAGRRGRTYAYLQQFESSGTISGKVSNVLPGASYPSKARSAFEQGQYDKVHQLLNKEEQRRLLIDGVLGSTGLAAVYGSSRVGASKWRQNRLSTVVDRVDSAYPITDGVLSGLEPTEFIAQGRTARDSLDSKTGVGLRRAFAEDYRELQHTLVQLHDRYPDLVSASESLATFDQSLLPDSLTAELRKAVEQGDIQEIDAYLETIKAADTLLNRLQSFSTSVSDSSFAISTTQFRPLVEQELSSRGSAIQGISLEEALSTIEDGVDAIQEFEGQLSIFDVTQKQSTIQSALQSPTDLTATTIREIGSFQDLFEAAADVEDELSQVDFSVVEMSYDEVEQRAGSLFAQSDVDGLTALADTLAETRIGRWSYNDLFSPSPTDFEHLVAALFGDMGYEVAVTDQQGDKGIDVIARDGSDVVVIQVKQYSRGNKVGRPTVQQIIGAMAQAGADRAVIVSSAGFTKTAINASNELGNIMQLINGSTLVDLLTDSSLHPQSSASTYRSHARSRSTSGSHSRSRSRSKSRQQKSRTTGGQTMSREEAYDILDLDSSASQSEIKSQYRAKVKEAHPDVGGSDEEFKQVKQAFDLLSED